MCGIQEHLRLARQQVERGGLAHGAARKVEAGLGVHLDHHGIGQHHLALLAGGGAVVGRHVGQRGPKPGRRAHHDEGRHAGRQRGAQEVAAPGVRDGGH